MKRFLIFAVIGTLALEGRAQLFSPGSLTGAALGSAVGAVIGHNSGRHAGEGAAIGAGAGLLLGAIANHEDRGYSSSPVVTISASPYYRSYYGSHGMFVHRFDERPAYYSAVSVRPSYAFSGAMVGGVAGAVIGHNSGRHAGEGAAIGVGAGLLLGALAEDNARRYERPVYIQQPPVYYAAAPAPVVVQQAPPAAMTLAPASAQDSTSGQTVIAPVIADAPTVPLAPMISSSPQMNSANSLFGR